MKMTEEDQIKLQVHHVRFFNCQPKTIHCICFDSTSSKVAVSRSDGSIEIHSSKDNWIQELVFPGSPDASVEALAWAGGRLFAAGLGGNIVELDLLTQSAKDTVSSNAGAIWCLTSNKSEDKLAAGTEDGCVVLYDVEGELQYLRGFGKQEGRIMSIAWYEREEESVIVTGGVNNIRQWSVKSGQPLSRMALGRKFQKDTIVWCVAVTRDFTIISGDSRGVVTFWNGKESTQLKTFHCHKADVLCLCLSQDEQTVYSSGVDAALYQFSLFLSDPGSERRRWVQQLLHSRHTHDVRALAYREGCLVSGGVDAVLRVARLKGKAAVWDVDPFPQAAVVGVATDKSLVQLQYTTYLEVWRLGAANQPFAAARGTLPLTRRPVRLVQLKARSGRQLLCSAMSADGVSAYSDTRGVRMFRINMKNDNSSTPDVSLTRLPCDLATPARLMTFGSQGQSLILVSASGKLYVVSVATGQVVHSIRPTGDSPIHRLTASPSSSHFATATTDRGVHLYSSDTGQAVCSCPVQQSQVSALAFSPHTPTLVIAYSNHAIYEFDVELHEYTSWSRAHSGQFRPSWLRPMSNVRGVVFPPDNTELIVFHTDTTLCVLDKTKATDKDLLTKSPGKTGQKMGNVRKCFKYKFLLSAQFLSSGMLVAVERTPSALEEDLPPSLKQVKFGLA